MFEGETSPEVLISIPNFLFNQLNLSKLCILLHFVNALLMRLFIKSWYTMFFVWYDFSCSCSWGFMNNSTFADHQARDKATPNCPRKKTQARRYMSTFSSVWPWTLLMVIEKQRRIGNHFLWKWTRYLSNFICCKGILGMNTLFP